ncbi:transmembrane channel-like protein 5 [Xenopus laevis]|uniref:Transmembrane channel-like protein n=2 Tax=Xenopus laevis TaxID=8355 RepID=A0A1L8EXU6_XENLA|nr:transmembrane channel-like protein 5 [Xenopus laevis]XP_018091835.1 transmembrane channel-like protein 5 [Xenopus laevis]OCT64109.1 hypothetical protein XELAEV_18045211mg [Xenopus laevis]
MSRKNSDGFINEAYHDSETLQLDRGRYNTSFSREKSSFYNPNPYNDDNIGYGEQPPERRQNRVFLPMNSVRQDPEYSQQIPRNFVPNNNPYGGDYSNPAFEPDSNTVAPYDYNGTRHPYFGSGVDLAEDPSFPRGSSRKSTAALQPRISEVDPSLEKQENKELVRKLADLPTADIAKELKKLPTSVKEKRDLRNKVFLLKQKSYKGAYQMDCCNGCLHQIRVWFRKSKQSIADVLVLLQLWHSTLKVIGSKFGTSILSYFIFLKWLLRFNIFSFIVNFSFITIPQFFDMNPNNLSFSGLELLTGAGYFQDTVLYYGFYTNSTIRNNESLAPYNMQLAYIFTIGLYLAACFLILLFSMARSFRKNFINPASFSGNACKLLCSWDFSITHEKAVNLKRKNLSTQIKESLSEKLQEKLKLTVNQRIVRFLIHLAAWLVSSGIAAGCCAGVYYLCLNLQSIQNASANELTRQAATLLVPVVVALINMIIPLVYAMFFLVEKYKYPRHEIYVEIIRNVLLKISIIGILCYYWLHSVAESQSECWESFVGEDVYRLVVVDFIFALIGSFFGEFIRRIIGMHCCKKLGMPEFDIARNVLDLIYAQTLAWIGMFFSPLLPIIQIIKLFIIFYVKKVSLMMNCTPPRRAWRAAQMTTIFIFILFFPSFAGVLCMIGATVWRRQPSQNCGPFRGLETPYQSISNWVSSLTIFENSLWVVWIYENIVESVLFFYILTLIVLIISYLYWQIIQGRKIMVQHLYQQIANEGKDKSFLLHELRKAQSLNEAPGRAPYRAAQRQVQPSYRNQEMHTVNEHIPLESRGESIGTSDVLGLVMRARQQAEMEERSSALNSNLSSNNGNPLDSPGQAWSSRKQQDPNREPVWNNNSRQEAIAMVMRERQLAERGPPTG